MQKEKIKTQKGITLIALIITIIVMLILVGVSVTVALNGGLFNKAKEAAQGTKTESEKEQLLEIAMGTLGEYGTVDITKLEERLGDNYEVTGDAETGYVCENTETGKKYTISKYGIVSDYTANEPEGPEWTWADGTNSGNVSEKLDIGDVVTHKSGEQFYVISSDNTVNVTLLAKMNIDTTTLKQSSSANTIAFSSTNYWSSSFTASPYDLTETEGETPDPGHYAALAAYNYGERFGATGRLMTKTEADGLTSYSDILYGPSGAKLNYWLGSASDTNYVWCVLGGSSGVGSNRFSGDNSFGVRPVITISESSIS